MILLNLNEAMEKILATDGKIFSAVFEKKDKTDRHIYGRLGVKKGLTGKGLKYSPKAYGLIPMFDFYKREYRMLNVATLKSLQIDGVVYSIRR